jgi:urea transporter
MSLSLKKTTEVQTIFKSVLNSYGMLFFTQQSFFSWMVLLISFFIPQSGLAGLIAVFTSVITSRLLGFDYNQIKTGLYSYSALLFGLGFAANFQWGNAFFLLLIIGAVLTTLFSVAISTKLNAKNIPGLSLAFIFTTWIVLLASKQFGYMGLTQRNLYWVNETYAIGGNTLLNFVQALENWKLAPYISGFFRSMSAIIFQGNILAGILLSLGLLINSRISFILAITGYSIAILFNYLMGGFKTGDLSYYNMGTNFILVAIALGGFYLIPSVRSFLWTLITVPISYLLVVGLGTITYSFGLPVFSLPFCMVVILFLYCLQLRKNPGRIVTTPIQYYNPEINLYRYLNGKERLYNRYYQQLSLPVLGEWMISQGYDGSITHKGDWSKAIDFVILDEQMKTFQLPGNLPEHFYCFNKPVIAPADGIVVEIIDYIEDNEIGKNNTAQNWGNTIIIKHAANLYSKLSHLKQYSVKVKKDSFVRKGDIIALCGNSGRSPEPHLHFQVQATPHIGSKTLHYPLSNFYSRKDNEVSFENISVPREGNFVCNVIPNHQLQSAFSFQPGFVMKVDAPGMDDEEWEVFTDEYNETYFYCKEQQAIAYFFNNGNVFYFTNFIGNKKSLLYYFYVAAYKVLLSTEKNIPIQDSYPISLFSNNITRWVQDFMAPFFIFIKIEFESNASGEDNFLGGGKTQIESRQSYRIFGNKRDISSASINIENNKIINFSLQLKNKNIKATCEFVQ